MGPTVKENGVLKLVHPGGLVEIHTTPITAAEVMKMNPRHCVARPDVFKYPWIVVRPESVLRPGSLFYIVPHHTMRKLMLKAQEKELLQQGRLLITQHSAENKSFNKGNREKSIFKHNGGSKQSRVACFDQSATDYASVDLSYFNSMAPSHCTDQSFGSQASGLSAFSEVMNSSEEATTVKKERNQQAVTPNIRIVQRRDVRQDECHGRRRTEMDPQKLQLTLERLVSVQRPTGNSTTVPVTENSNRMTGLKSCLKTRETTNMSTTNLRVRFMLPGDEEKIMRTRSWLLEINPETAY